MKDVTGKDINIGDKVVTNIGGYLDLRICYVDSFTDKKVRLFNNGKSVGCKFSTQVAVVCSDGASLPDHHDNTPRVDRFKIDDLSKAVNDKKATYLGHSAYSKDCFWMFYVWENRYYCFLNEVGLNCWEVSKTCVDNYLEG